MKHHWKMLAFALVMLIVVGTTSAQPLGPDTLWTYQYQGIDDDLSKDIVAMVDGGFVVLIETEPLAGDSGRAGLIRVSSQGHVLWQQLYREWGLRITTAFAPTHDDGFVIAGTGGSGADQAVLRVDSVGIPLWYRHYNIPFAGWAEDIVETPDGGFALLTHGDVGNSPTIVLMRLNAVGDSMWTRRYGGAGSEYGSQLVQTADGGFLLEAIRSRYVPPILMQPWLIKTDSQGQVQWDRLLGTDGDEWCYSLALTADGGCVIAGAWNPDGSLNPNYGFAARLTATGDSVWAYIWEDVLGGFSGCAALPDGNFALCGNLYSPDGASMYYVMQIDGDGQRQWQRTYVDGSSYAMLAKTCILSDGSIAVCGFQQNGPDTREDAWAARLVPAETSNPRIFPLPSTIALSAYPNPFNSMTMIQIQAGAPFTGELTLCDILGRRVICVFNGRISSGSYMTRLDLTGYPSGTYYVVLQAMEYSKVQSVKLVR